MAITFYFGSGSPYAWRVQLALEHKALEYDLKTLSFSAGDMRKPEFLAINPRHRIPVIVDGDFVLYESNAIVEYLDEAYPGRGRPLYPGDVKTRALVRRLILEVDNYYDKTADKLLDQVFWTKPEDRDFQKIDEGKQALIEEHAMFTKAMHGDFLAGPLSAADFAFYPMVAFLKRGETKMPDLDSDALLTPQLLKWKARVEALPYFATTIPPHWRQA